MKKFSAEIDSRTGNSIGHPTLSVYREVPFNKTISISDATIKFIDNYVLLFIENKDDQSAVNYALSFINRFCQILSIRNGHYFYYGIVQAISGERKVLVPRNLNLLSARLYNLNTISEHIDEIVNITSIDVDPILEKAKAYFCHALYMNNEIAEKLSLFLFIVY